MVFEYIVAQAVALIRRFEGCVLTAYQDVGGVWTIGYGSTGLDVYPGLVWTREQAERRLENDVRRFVLAVLTLCPAIWDNGYIALCSFCYNVGLGRFRASTLRKYVCSGNPQKAALEFLKWNKVNGRVNKGLTLRRSTESNIFLTP